MWKTYFEQNVELGKRYTPPLVNFMKEVKGQLERPRGEYVILLFSGGMDSVTLFDILIQKWDCKVIPLYFMRHAGNESWELEAVHYFHDFYKQKYPDNVLDLELLEIEIPSRQNKQYFDRERQKYLGLPLRNHIMWSNAFTQAVYLSGKYNTTIRSVVVGSVLDDGNSPESGMFAINAYNLSVCASLGIWHYQLMAPLIDESLDKIYTKKDLVTYCINNQIMLNKSRSCFSKQKEPCLECLACQNKTQALNQALF